MTTPTRKFFTTAIAAIMLSGAVAATTQTAGAGQWRHNHGHGHGMSRGAAIGFGIAMFATAIAANAARQQQARLKHGTAAKRCSQAKRWIRLALAAERNGDQVSARYRWRKAKQARRDCNRW